MIRNNFLRGSNAWAKFWKPDDKKGSKEAKHLKEERTRAMKHFRMLEDLQVVLYTHSSQENIWGTMQGLCPNLINFTHGRVDERGNHKQI